MGKHHTVQDTNPNTAWLHHAGFKYVYAFLMCAACLFVRSVFVSSTAVAWTVIVLAHSIITFFLFHWVKGAPEGGTLQVDVAHLTFWEQIDDGYFGTPNRRFLVIVPIVLFFVSLVYNGDDMIAFAINASATLFALIPKHESLFGVRLFGINKLD